MTRTPIDDYLVTVPQPQRGTLDTVRARIRSLLPGATETISYAIPTYDLDGIHAIGFAAFQQHWSLFPYSAHVISAHASDLAHYRHSRGTVQFPADEPVPMALLRRLVDSRLRELSTTWPRTGTARMFYPDGTVKLRGRTKDGKAHGEWRWYRRDGSVMRIGQFTRGVPSGRWTTVDRSGSVVRTSAAPRTFGPED